MYHLLMFRGSVRGGPAERSILEAYVARWMWFRIMLDGFGRIAAVGSVRRSTVAADDRSEYIG
jgi:hypothetical protein